MRGKGVNYLCGILLISPLLSIVYSGCGISTTAYLYPPANITISSSQITVQNDGANYEPSEGSSQTFKGIDIFYRIFQDYIKAGNMFTSLNDWVDTYSGNPEAFINRVKSNGFFPMRRASTAMQPLITLAATDESLHTIDTSNWKLDGIVQVVRNVTKSESDFSAKDFNSTDQDYEGDNSLGVGTFYMVLFAVSYGEDTIGAPVYSDPVVATSILEF